MVAAGSLAQRLRLASGIVLFFFAATHLLNHALGLISVAAMEVGREWFVEVWRSTAGTALLVVAAALHVALAFGKLFRGRSLALPVWQWSQLVLGIAIPFLLAAHVLGTRGLAERFWVDPSYPWVLHGLWPDGAIRQSALVLIVWGHGCIGLHFWLRMKPWYERWLPVLYGVALIVPTLALLGFAAAGREVAAAAAQPGWLEALRQGVGWPGPQAAAFVSRWESATVGGFAALLAGLVGVRLARLALDRRRGTVRLTYPDGRIVAVAPGTTVLEASRMACIPHASVCGGRGRCSTFRIRVGAGRDELPPPSADERRVLERIAAPETVRLACQLRPVASIEVTPLLPPSAGPRDARPQPGYRQGTEREIAILFADLRAFTRMAERKLPYDVVFILNQYFRAMGRAIELSGGHVDKFIGDGVMALFGLTDGAEAGCRNALAAARAMAETLEELNRALGHDLPEPLRIGVGIHAGAVIVGEMGYKEATSITAIGDPVNVASRLEGMTKELDCQLIVSESVARRAGADLSAFASREIAIRGRERPLTIYAVADARAVPESRSRAAA